MAKPSKTRRRRKIRHIQVPGKETAGERQARTAMQYIMGNPYYPVILKAIRQGTPNSQIAAALISRGVFDVNQKTAVGYLQYFKKMQPSLCKPVKPDSDASPDADYIDNLFDAGHIIMDEETELLRLIALQKARLGLMYHSEKQIGMLMTSSKKEVEELRELLTALAKLRGKLGSTVDVNMYNYNDSVRDDLKGIQQDEGQRNTIATLVADLAAQNA